MGRLDDPYQSGLGFTVALHKQVDFRGRDALSARREAPELRRLVSVKLAERGVGLWHGESVLVDGRRAGHVTSGAFGPTIGAPVGLAWVHAEAAGSPVLPEGAIVQVEVRGRLVPARADPRPFFDPGGSRLRG